jgi:hypothetical protein
MTYEEKYDFLRNADCEIIDENGLGCTSYEIDADMAHALINGEVQGAWHKVYDGVCFVFAETGETLTFSHDEDARTAAMIFAA